MTNDQQPTIGSPPQVPDLRPPTSDLSRPGRPRALDDTSAANLRLISAGCGLEGAARYVGCDPSTIRREARRNQDFAQQLRHAQRDCELVPLNAMHKAANRYWRAAAWLLERTHAQPFGKIDPQTIKLVQLQNTPPHSWGLSVER